MTFLESPRAIGNLTTPQTRATPIDVVATPDRVTLLALIDRNMVEMYREMTRTTPGGELVEMDGLTMTWTPRGHAITNMAMVTAAITPARVCDLADRVYRHAGRPFSLWTRAHADAELEAGLEAVGFRALMAVPGMVLLPSNGRSVLPPADVTIRPVADDAGRADYGYVAKKAYAVYGAPEESTSAHFDTLASVMGPTTQAFLAYDRDGRVVAAATLYLSHGVAGVGWVATLPEEFRRGYGAAVTSAVVEAGRERGAAFASLQASPMGAPVYRRMGFSTPTHYRVFVAGD
jgi:ribosomal protein S18 acetylase RimI-like enzyme